MIDHKIQSAIIKAIGFLKEERRPLAFGDVHERSTAHRLAVHLEHLFRGWDVDCEYNRDHLITKYLTAEGCADPVTGAIVLPDIIIHRRQRQHRENNLVVIEIKNLDPADECDARKLKLFTSSNGYYQYQVGLYVNINHGRFDLTWYEDGSIVLT